jgi:hypothetical protein
MQFYLRDAASGGNPVGVTNTVAPVNVTNGLFTVLLDFGPGIFDGNNLWLEIGVRTNGSVSPYSTLSPRQPLTPSPYAIMANSASNLLGTAGTATNFSGSLSGDVTGTESATVVSQVGGQGAGNVASGVIAANAATSANIPNTIVRRDGFGNFSAGTINLSGTLNLPVTSATAGIINFGRQQNPACLRGEKLFRRIPGGQPHDDRER